MMACPTITISRMGRSTHLLDTLGCRVTRYQRCATALTMRSHVVLAAEEARGAGAASIRHGINSSAAHATRANSIGIHGAALRSLAARRIVSPRAVPSSYVSQAR